MREFLEDAHKHQDSGAGRAEASAKRELPKRFYKKVSVEDAEGGYAVLLDGRPIKTPGRLQVVLPKRPLADLVAAEWDAQTEFVDPMTMPALRLLNSALEGGTASVSALQDEIIKYAGNDLLLYRADTPRELVAAQEAAWDAMLVALAREFGVKFQPTVGIIHQSQPKDTLDKLSELVGPEDHFALTAMMSITGLSGSGLLAIALRRNLVDPEDAWKAAHVDEDHNIRLWGADPEAEARRAKRREEFDAAVTVLDLLD